MEPRSPQGEENHNADNGKTSDHLKNAYWKAIRIVAFFGIVESLSLVLWVKSEDFSPDVARHFRWAATCGFLAGGGFIAHKLTGGRFKQKIVFGIWVMWAIVCVVLLLTIPELPSFQLGLYANDDHGEPVFLTKHFLEIPLKNDAKIIPYSAADFKGFVVVPVLQGASNCEIRFRLSTSNAVGDHVGLKMMYSIDAHVAFDSNFWFEQPDDIPGYRTIACEASMITPLRSPISHPLTFDVRTAKARANSSNEDAGPIPIIVAIFSTSSKPQAFAFQLEFIEIPRMKDGIQLPKPFSMLGTEVGAAYTLVLDAGLGADGKWKFIQVIPPKNESGGGNETMLIATIVFVVALVVIAVIIYAIRN